MERPCLSEVIVMNTRCISSLKGFLQWKAEKLDVARFILEKKPHSPKQGMMEYVSALDSLKVNGDYRRQKTINSENYGESLTTFAEKRRGSPTQKWASRMGRSRCWLDRRRLCFYKDGLVRLLTWKGKSLCLNCVMWEMLFP